MIFTIRNVLNIKLKKYTLNKHVSNKKSTNKRKHKINMNII